MKVNRLGFFRRIHHSNIREYATGGTGRSSCASGIFCIWGRVAVRTNDLQGIYVRRAYNSQHVHEAEHL